MALACGCAFLGSPCCICILTCRRLKQVCTLNSQVADFGSYQFLGRPCARHAATTQQGCSTHNLPAPKDIHQSEPGDLCCRCQLQTASTSCWAARLRSASKRVKLSSGLLWKLATRRQTPMPSPMGWLRRPSPQIPSRPIHHPSTAKLLTGQHLCLRDLMAVTCTALCGVTFEQLRCAQLKYSKHMGLCCTAVPTHSPASSASWVCHAGMGQTVSQTP